VTQVFRRGKIPIKKEILEVACEMYIEDCIKNGVEPLTPTEHELKEAGYYEKAKLYLMRNIHADELEEKFRQDEINYAIRVLEENGFIIRTPTFLNDPEMLEIEIRTLQIAKRKAMIQKYSKLVRKL